MDCVSIHIPLCSFPGSDLAQAASLSLTQHTGSFSHTNPLSLVQPVNGLRSGSVRRNLGVSMADWYQTARTIEWQRPEVSVRARSEETSGYERFSYQSTCRKIPCSRVSTARRLVRRACPPCGTRHSFNDAGSFRAPHRHSCPLTPRVVNAMPASASPVLTWSCHLPVLVLIIPEMKSVRDARLLHGDSAYGW